jgi:hypothetical protein
MSVDSPAEVIPFERFLDCRERRRRIAAATGTVVMPASTDFEHSARTDRTCER